MFTNSLIEMGTVNDKDKDPSKFVEYLKNPDGDGASLSNFVVASISFVKEAYTGLILPNTSIVYPKQSMQYSTQNKDEL